MPLTPRSLTILQSKETSEHAVFRIWCFHKKIKFYWTHLYRIGPVIPIIFFIYRLATLGRPKLNFDALTFLGAMGWWQLIPWLLCSGVKIVNWFKFARKSIVAPIWKIEIFVYMNKSVSISKATSTFSIKNLWLVSVTENKRPALLEAAKQPIFYNKVQKKTFGDSTIAIPSMPFLSTDSSTRQFNCKKRKS